MGGPDCMERIAVLTNLLSPSSVHTYDALARMWPHLAVFLTGQESNRSWKLEGPWAFEVRRPWGMVFRRHIRGHGSRRFDVGYLHLPLGLFPALWRYRPDAILSSELGLRTVMAWAYCRWHRIPLVVHWEGTPHNQRRAGRMKTLIRRRCMIHMPQGWVACGSESRRYLEALGVHGDRIAVTGYAVNPVFFADAVQPRLSLSPKPVLMVVGRLVRLKGLRELLHAVAALQREGVRFTTLMVGDGDERPLLDDLVRRLSLEHVVFHPSVEPPELPAFYASADVLLFPSLCDGWGLVVGEALAAGVPVLSSIFAGATADLVPPQWRFDPTQHAGFVAALRAAVAVGREGRRCFPSKADLPTPERVACVLSDALYQAGTRLS